jgi:hypothetical protein
MLTEQQEPARDGTTVNLQQKSSPSGTEVVSETDKKMARICASEKKAVSTLLPLDGFEVHWAALPAALAPVMQAGSQLRSICRPLTLPLLPAMSTHTLVEGDPAATWPTTRSWILPPPQAAKHRIPRIDAMRWLSLTMNVSQLSHSW